MIFVHFTSEQQRRFLVCSVLMENSHVDCVLQLQLEWRLG
jgi:hypothetical protein